MAMRNTIRKLVARGEEITLDKGWQRDFVIRTEAIKIEGQLERKLKTQRRLLKYPKRSSLYRHAVVVQKEISIRLGLSEQRNIRAIDKACLTTKRTIEYA